ncbi:MAG: hypothetical protein R6V35_03915 [Candidatus Nanohaloarchaea archaeon]
MTGLASAANLTVEVWDEDENVQDANLLLEQDGATIDDGTVIDTEVNDGEDYNFTQEVNGLEITIYNFSISQDMDFRPRILDLDVPQGSDYLTELDPFYFVNQSFDFSHAEINSGKTETPDRIAKCTEFSDLRCESWEVNSTSDYEDNSPLDSETYSYEVNNFSAYSTGNNASLPVINNLEIFNVTDLADQRTSGEKISEGLNKTFLIDHKRWNQYRFEFNLSNNGSEDWDLSSGDLLEHRGLNSSWSVNNSDIYYTIDQTFDGGSFDSGVVEWNTGNGGTLGTNEGMSAEYIVNVSQNSTSTYDQEFEANSSEGGSEIDFHELEILIYGFLDPVIERPEDGSIVQNNRNFKLNGTVKCRDGDCGEIDLTPRRNSSNGQIAIDGSVFDIQDSSRSNCQSLLEDEVCEVEWSVNATGDPDISHKIDFLADSNYQEVGSDSTELSEVTIRDILLVDLDWNTVDFGILDPGEREKPARNNSGGYNLTVEEESNKIDNLWLKGSELVNEENSNYTIGIGNMSYAQKNEVDQSSNITSNYSLINTDLSPGLTKTFYYWIDVPLGILRGAYSGSITFKANQTE